MDCIISIQYNGQKIIDNYSQAKGYMSRMEARLEKTGRLDEFNRQFQDNVEMCENTR
jgi:hypothetical protein